MHLSSCRKGIIYLQGAKNMRAGQQTSELQLSEGTGELYISISGPDDRKQTISQLKIFRKI